MALNRYCSLVLFATLTLVNLNLCESKGVDFGQRPSDLSSFIHNSDVSKGILNAIIQHQGSSVSQIHNIVLGSGGNLNQAIDGINAELKENILRVDGDAVRINPDALKNILKSAFQSVIRNGLSEAPAVASVLEDKVSKKIDSETPEFIQAVEESSIPLDVAERSLVVARTKRSEPLAFDLSEIINNIVLGILRDQLGSLVVGVLENLKDILGGNLILVAPGNPIGDFIAAAVNFGIKSILEVITIIQESLLPQVVSESRRKRDLLGDITDVIDGVLPDDVAESAGGLLDGVVRPILTLLGTVLGPVNVILKGLIAGVAGTLQPVLGSLVTERVLAVINSVLDLLIPTVPV